MMNTNNHPETYTLETIREERARIKEELKACTARMRTNSSELIKPTKSQSKIGALIGSFDNALSIAEGVFMGYKIISRFKRSWRNR